MAESLFEQMQKARSGETTPADLLRDASISSTRNSFNVRTQSNESFGQLLSRISASERTKKGLKALKKEPETQARRGVLETLFGQEKGILTAPARFVTALLADTLDIPFDDREARRALDKYNPLEAAVRSAAGEFAITGGDVFRVNKDDSFVTRLAKYAGALTIDITTDPINYVGGVGTLSRKGLATMAVREGENMLPILTSVASKSKRGAESVIDELFEANRATQAAKLGDERSMARLFPNGTVDPAARTQGAGNMLGYLVGANFERFGRAGVRKGIADLLDSDDLAKEFMERLSVELGTEVGEQLTGGFFVKNPLTGAPVARLAGGKGASNVVTRALNEARFLATANPAATFASRHFSGKYGMAWSEVKRHLIGGVDLKNIPKTSLLDYVSLKDTLAKANREITALGNATNEFAAFAYKARAASENVDMFDEQLTKHFNAPRLGLSTGAEVIERDAYELAQYVRQAINAARQMKIDAGLPVGNLGEDWIMLRFTDEYYEELRKKGLVSGGEELKYRPGKGRIAEVEYLPDSEIAKRQGFQMPNARQTTALSPRALNEKLGLSAGGNKIYEDDPLKVAITYLEEVHRAVVQKRMVEALERTGTVLVLPQQVQQVLIAKDAAAFVSGVRKVSPQVAARAQAYVNDAAKKLEQLLDQETLEPVQEAVRQQIAEATQQVFDTTAVVEQAQEAMSSAARRVNEVTPTEAQIRSALTEVANVDSRKVVDELARLRDSAKRRSDRLADRMEQQEQSYEFIANELGIPGPPEGALTEDMVEWLDMAAELDVDMRRTAAQMYDEIETYEELIDDLARSREFRETVIRDTTSDLYQTYLLREQALDAQRLAKEQLEQARRARREAVTGLRNAQKESGLLRAGVIDGVVWDYVGKRQAWLEMQARYKNRKISELPDAERAAYNQAKEASAIARRLMERTLSYSTRRTYKGAGAAYAKTVVEMAEKLSVEQFKLASVIANTNKLNQMADALQGVRMRTQMQAVGDLFSTYKTIRELLTKDDLRMLEKHEYKMLVSPKGMRGMVRAEKVETEIQRAVFLDEEFARVGINKTNVATPVAMKDVYAAKGVRGVLEDIYQLHTDQNEWQKFVSRIYDPAATVWRTSATVGRGPAFVLNNVLGGHVNNYLGGVSIRDHKTSATMLAESLKTIRKVIKDNPNAMTTDLMNAAEEALKRRFGGVTVRDRELVDLYVEFFERGGHFDTDTFFQNQQLREQGFAAPLSTGLHGNVGVQFTEEATSKSENVYRRFVNFALTNPVQRAFSDASQSSEIYLRFAAFVSGYRRFGNLDSAMDLTHMLHFDYSSLSSAEQWVRRLVPFYTWSRNNVPLWIRASFVQSPKVTKLFRAQEEFEAAFDVDGDAEWMKEYMPEWLGASGGFISYLKVGGNHLALFPRMPLNDVDKLLTVRYIGSVPFPIFRQDELGSMLGPAGKTAIEWITNRNFQYGYEYADIGDKIIKTIQQSVPYVGTGKKVLSGVAGIGDRERRVSNLIGILAGTPYGATTITEKTLSGTAYGQNMKLSQQLKDAAAEAGVDYEWLRKELTKGTSLRSLTMKIGAGQGDIQTIALRKRFDSFLKGGSTKDDKDYNAILRDLRAG
jgi:hypothetical protein